jgi:hypothetical protein
MPKYLMWRNHEEVQPAESGVNEDGEKMNDMIADIGREYDLGSIEQHPSPVV